MGKVDHRKTLAYATRETPTDGAPERNKKFKVSSGGRVTGEGEGLSFSL